MRSVFILNAGSSSVKASLLLADPSSDPTSDPASSTAPQPVRLLTALAERLNTSDSVLHLTISVSAARAALHNYHSHLPTQKKEFLRSNSLSVAARSTVDHFDTQDMMSSSPSTDTLVEKKNVKVQETFLTHKTAVERILEEMNRFDPLLLSSVFAVGHRVVHGGSSFVRSVIVNDDVLKAIQDVTHLAPLHNPANIMGIQIARQFFPSHIPNIAVFDTAFHSTMPDYAFTYPIPKEYRENQIRRFGFHGTSVQYVSRIGEAIVKSVKPSRNFHSEPVKLIVAHLGNGASVTAVVNGKSMDTTMEFTPLTGIMMGTRSGSVDPTIVTFASQAMNKKPEEVLNDLNKKSGLLGVGGNNDMRAILQAAESGDKEASLAVAMFVYILAKHIAALLVSCGGVTDALVFTAGIGENSSLIREKTVEKLSVILGGVLLDDELNKVHGKLSRGIISKEFMADISDNGLRMQPLILVIPTDEEAMIQLECERLVNIKSLDN